MSANSYRPSWLLPDHVLHHSAHPVPLYPCLPVTPIGCPVCFSSKCPIGSWQLSPRAARRGLSPENSLSKEFLVVWSLASLLLLALRFCKEKSTFLHGTTEVALKWQQVQWPATFCRKLTLLSLHKTLGEASLGDVCMSWTKA